MWRIVEFAEIQWILKIWQRSVRHFINDFSFTFWRNVANVINVHNVRWIAKMCENLFKLHILQCILNGRCQSSWRIIFKIFVEITQHTCISPKNSTLQQKFWKYFQIDWQLPFKIHHKICEYVFFLFVNWGPVAFLFGLRKMLLNKDDIIFRFCSCCYCLQWIEKKKKIEKKLPQTHVLATFRFFSFFSNCESHTDHKSNSLSTFHPYHIECLNLLNNTFSSNLNGHDILTIF